MYIIYNILLLLVFYRYKISKNVSLFKDLGPNCSCVHNNVFNSLLPFI